MGKWIKFEETESSGKTKKFAVTAKEDGAKLGNIKWHGPWRKYCFFPESNTLFETDCMDDISSFLRNLMNERKSKRIIEFEKWTRQ